MRQPIRFTPLPRTGDTMRGRLSAVNADGLEFRRDIAVTERAARMFPEGADVMAFEIEKGARQMVREIERHEPPALDHAIYGTSISRVSWNTAPTHEELFDLVTNIDPWQTSFLSLGTGISSVQTGAPPAPLPPLEPVPLSDLLVGADFCAVERALEFIS